MQIRTPRRDWHSLEDVRPPLAEFELRCGTGDYDTAATVLRNLDNYLEKWGHYRTLVGLHGRIHGRIATPAMNASHLSNLGFATTACVSTDGLLTCKPKHWPSPGKRATARARAPD